MSASGYMIVGLGNPGSQYEDTRHSVGFGAIDSYAATIGAQLGQSKWKGEYCRERVAGVSVILVKPQTFMNRSGECVVRFQDYFKIPLENILVLHDDLDLAPGKIKVVAQGGPGGHNGIKSLIQHLGTQKFARVKVGIGRPHADNGGAAVPVERFVLARFSQDEELLIRERMDFISEAIQLFIEKGVQTTMGKINGKT